MNYDDLANRLKKLRIEEFIWIIYIGIIVMSFHANRFERKYFIYNDLESKEKYRNMLILIFSILIIVYLYFVQDSYNDIKSLKPYDTDKKKNLTYLSFLASLLIAISGFIFLYIAIMDEEIDVELAFN